MGSECVLNQSCFIPSAPPAAASIAALLCFGGGIGFSFCKQQQRCFPTQSLARKMHGDDNEHLTK